MSKDDRWIATRIAEARTGRPLVTAAVAAEMDHLLKGRLSEGQLPVGDLAKVTTALIAGMAPAPSKAEANE